MRIDSELDRLISVMRKSPHPVIICDAEGKLIFLNDVAESAYPCLRKIGSVHDWKSSYSISNTQGESLSGDHLPLLRALSGQQVEDEVAFLFNKAAGRAYSMRVSAHPIMQDDKIVGAVSVHKPLESIIDRC